MHRALVACAVFAMAAAVLIACEQPVPPPSAPRPISPLSGATVVSRYPGFRWQLGANSDGVRLLICAVREACEIPTPCDVDAGDATAEDTDACTPVMDVPRADAGIDAEAGIVEDTGIDADAGIVEDAGTPVEVPRPEVEIDLRGSGGMQPRPDGGDGGDAGPPIGLTPGIHYWTLIGVRGSNRGDHGPIWQFEVPVPRPAVDALPPASLPSDRISSGTRADFNADGYSDLVVGTRRAALVYLGSARGLAASPSMVLDAPEELDDPFGSSVGTAGDVNGDGYPDLFVGAERSFERGPGRAYVYLGNRNGVATTPNDQFADIDGTGFGVDGIASGGDLNADGYGDLLVADPDWHLSTSDASGRVIGYMGSILGPSASQSVTIAGTDGSATRFGVSLATAGDLDADGFPDLLIGGSTGGRAFLVQSVMVPQTSCANTSAPCAGLFATPTATLNGDVPPGGPEQTVVANAGDINNDGRTDAVVGVGSRISVFLGTSPITGLGMRLDAVLDIPDVGMDPMRELVISAADVDRDGYSDVIVGADARFGGGGNAYVFFGSAGGLTQLNAMVLVPPAGAFGFARSVAGLGDVNGDGFDDFAIGAPDAGAVFVYLGGSPPSQTPALVLTGGEQYGPGFGRSLI